MSLDMAPAEVNVERTADGGMILTSPQELGPYHRHLGEALRHWAQAAPDRVFLAERDGEGNWRRLTFGAARAGADGIAQALLDRGLDETTPVMILSGNSINFALLQLAAMQAGIPVAPVSPAYSLMSQDFSKLKYIHALVEPRLIFAENGAAFAKALRALPLEDEEVVVGAAPPEGIAATDFAELRSAAPGPAVEEAFARVGPDSLAKVLFTSGSTGQPKGVINTQRMLCANQQQIVQLWRFLAQRPPVLVDWLPWNHTFGGNHDFDLVLVRGGTLYIDAGRPLPGLVEQTVRNLAEISPTLYLNVPAGFKMLLPFLEADDGLRDTFFRELDVIFYAGAALPQDLWERLEALSVTATGRPVMMLSSWGSTETAPMATTVHFPMDRAGVIGLPAPGTAIKLAPEGSKMELRVKGPNVTPGYYKRPDLTEAAFDEQGFYRMGDAGKLDDPDDPAKGLVFDGRTGEDFKLTTGTWVHASGVRIAALEAAAPALQDAVVTGHDREWLGLLAWPHLASCRAIAGLGDEADPGDVIAHPAVREHVLAGLRRYNEGSGGSSTRIARVLLMGEPPSMDANEVTDKGYINQRGTLERRAALVERLHEEPPGDDVIVV